MDPNRYPALQNHQGFCFALTGRELPYYCNANSKFTLQHLDPTTTPTEVHSAAGSMSAVTSQGYLYFYTECNVNTGDSIHNVHETNPSPTSVATGMFSTQKVVVTLPGSAVNTDTTHLKIYGTDDGENIFYYLGNVAIGTTTFDDDNIARDANVAFGELTTEVDGSITQTYLNYAVKNHRYITATESRLMVCGTDPYVNGTATVVNGDATVTFSVADKTRAVVGDFFQKSGDTRVYEVASFTSASEIELTEAYAGTGSTSAYTLGGKNDVVRWSATNPNTAQSMWWAFPVDYYRIIHKKDFSPIMGCNKIGNLPIIYKRYSHYMLTENGNDFLEQESRTAVGTCSHWSIVETSTLGTNIFMTYEGQIYETTGLEAMDLNIDLSLSVDGINKSRLEYVQGKWFHDKQWYLLAYSAEGSSEHDRVLVYDKSIKQWVIWAIRGNCLGMIESLEGGYKTFKPWLGSRGGFPYKMIIGDNFGAGSSGTVEGTITSATGTTLVDTGASFLTTDDAHKDVYVSIFDTDDNFVEEKQISSNTSTELTVDAWDTTPTVGYTYEIGSIRWYWKSKVLDFEVNESKALNKVLVNFKKVSVERNIKIKIFVSESPTMPTTEDQTITFDLSQDYYEPLGIQDVRARYFQYELSGHGSADPIEINNLALELNTYTR